jgi:hypothetical protein
MGEGDANVFVSLGSSNLDVAVVLSELQAFIKRVGRERLLFLRPLPECIRVCPLDWAMDSLEPLLMLR